MYQNSDASENRLAHPGGRGNRRGGRGRRAFKQCSRFEELRTPGNKEYVIEKSNSLGDFFAYCQETGVVCVYYSTVEGKSEFLTDVPPNSPVDSVENYISQSNVYENKIVSTLPLALLIFLYIFLCIYSTL